MPIGCPQVEQEGPFSSDTHKFYNIFLLLETTEGTAKYSLQTLC